MDRTTLTFSNGDKLTVHGDLDAVSMQLTTSGWPELKVGPEGEEPTMIRVSAAHVIYYAPAGVRLTPTT